MTIVVPLEEGVGFEPTRRFRLTVFGTAGLSRSPTLPFSGDPGAIRTPDPRLRRAVLYPLSYGTLCSFDQIEPCRIAYPLVFGERRVRHVTSCRIPAVCR